MGQLVQLITCSFSKIRFASFFSPFNSCVMGTANHIAPTAPAILNDNNNNNTFSLKTGTHSP